MQLSFLCVEIAMSFNGLRLEYALDGSLNYIAWRDRMEAVLEDNGLKEFIDAEIPKPDLVMLQHLMHGKRRQQSVEELCWKV